jgi:hypothetical protein
LLNLPLLHSDTESQSIKLTRVSERIVEMRGVFVFLVFLSIGGFEAASHASAQAATQYPFCIQGVDNPGWSGCSFNTYQECQAAASGTEAECLSNPWYKASDSGALAPGGDLTGADSPVGSGMLGSTAAQTVT